MVFAFIIHGPRLTVFRFESRRRVGHFSRSAKVQELPASPSSSELSAHRMAPGGVIAHLRGRRAREPMDAGSL